MSSHRIKNILHLNNDCLFEICSKLVCKDQINFALSCKQFMELFKKYAKLNYKMINELELDAEQRKIFVKLAGIYIENCADVGIADCLIRETTQIRSQLKQLHINYSCINHCHFQNLKKFRKLEVLQIDVQNSAPFSMCYFLNMLQELPRLRVFDFTGSLAAEDFKKLNFTYPQLEEFTLSTLMGDYHTIAQICAFMPNLRKFTLRYEELNIIILQALILHCKNLEFLMCQLSYDDDAQRLIVELENLKCLYLHPAPRCTADLLTVLAAHGHPLECLHISVDYLYPSHLNLNMLQALAHLRYLSLFLGTTDICDISRIILPNLEIFCMMNILEINLDDFYMQILRDNKNLRIIDLPYNRITKEFVTKADNFLKIQNIRQERTNLPIWFLCSMTKEIEEYARTTTYIKFCNKLPMDCDLSLMKLYKEYREFR